MAATSAKPTRERPAVALMPSLGVLRVGRAELWLVALLLTGAALRIWLIQAWRPAFVGFPDSSTYLYAARVSGQGLLFWNDYRPAGYPLFLTWLHLMYPNLSFVIVIQHVMGLLTALLLYLTVARFAQRRWMALLPAAVVALAGTQIYLEHSVVSEPLYTVLVVAALWCAGHSVDSEAMRRVLWLGGAGLLVGLATPVRSTGLLLAPVLIGWAAMTVRGRRPRLIAAAAVAVAFCLGIGPYLLYQHAHTGTWGLTRTTGDTLYGRTASFANCADFTPPSGTSGLCEPPGHRNENPDYYMFSQASPGVRLFGMAPNPRPPDYSWPADSKLGSFALSAISHQPFAYLWTTLQGLAKYVAPSLGTPAMVGWPHSQLIAGLHQPVVEAPTDAGEVAAYYPNEPVVHHSLGTLDAYANAARVEGPVTAILVLLMIGGFVFARGRVRKAVGLFGWSTVAMMLAPVLLLFYQARYATPAYGPLAAAGAMGIDQLLASGILRGVRRRVRFGSSAD